VPFGSDWRRLWVGNRREWQIAKAARRNLVLRGDGAAFGDQKAVSGNTECGVMMKAAPPAPFIITEAEFLLGVAAVDRGIGGRRGATPHAVAVSGGPL
jgi:hypothetical protein